MECGDKGNSEQKQSSTKENPDRECAKGRTGKEQTGIQKYDLRRHKYYKKGKKLYKR